MVAQPDRDLSARREEAMARLAVTTEALGVLEEALRAELGLPEPTAQALLAGARALCPVAASTGAELAVSAGPDHMWTVFVRNDDAGPRLRVRRLRLDAAPPASPSAGLSPAADAPGGAVAGQLAGLLRTGRQLDDEALR
jgi:hypothetical protein